jgi:MoxR-like ATPase
MYYDSILPFLKQAPWNAMRVESLDMTQIYLPAYVGDEQEILRGMAIQAEYLVNSKPRVYHVLPLDIYVMDASIARIVFYRNQPEPVTCTIYDVDYVPVARRITTGTAQDGKFYAFLPEGNGMAREEIVTADLINLATNRQIADVDVKYAIDITPIVNPKKVTLAPQGLFAGTLGDYTLSEGISYPAMIKRLFEDADFNLDDVNTTLKAPGSATGELGMGAIEETLDSYIRANPPMKKVPLMLGMTAVAKSAMVKDLCKRHGYRLVDMRVGFMSRLDFEGLSRSLPVDEALRLMSTTGKNAQDISVLKDATVLSYQALNQRILECTDDYIKLCERAIPILDESLADTSLDPETRNQLQNIRDNYAEKAKPPILFLDEIARSDKPIRQAMLQILDQKEFSSKKMTKARIICAANYPVEYEEEPGMAEAYIGEQMDDVAFNDRFIPLRVTPDDFKKSWGKWAKKNAAGFITVTAKSASGRLAFARIAVSEKPINFPTISGGNDPAFTLSPETVTLKPGEKIQFQIVSNNKEQILWESSSGEISYAGEFTAPMEETKIGDLKSVDARRPANLHRLTLEFLMQNPVPGSEFSENAYDFSEVLQKYKDNGEKDDLSTNPFPNFRTWEMISRYMYRVEDDTAEGEKLTANLDTIYGLVGIKCGKQFSEFLTSRGWKVAEAPRKNQLDSLVEANMKAGVPTLLVGPSSLGKTTRIKNFCRNPKNRTTMISINLSQLDRTDIMGALAGVSTAQFIAGPHMELLQNIPVDKNSDEAVLSRVLAPSAVATKKVLRRTGPGRGRMPKFNPDGSEITPDNLQLDGYEFVDVPVSSTNTPENPEQEKEMAKSAGVKSNLADALARLVTECDLPPQTTVRAPRTRYGIQLQEALNIPGQRIILFFDEMNRCNPILMSAVFEAISDYRIFGINFSSEKDRVTVVGACNVGSAYKQAEELDPAFAARFCILRRDHYEQSDVEGMLEYFDKCIKKGPKDEDYFSPLVLEWLKDMSTKGKLIEAISKVEERTVDRGCPSMRSINELSRYLTSNAKVFPVLHGAMLFEDPDTQDLRDKWQIEITRGASFATSGMKLKAYCDQIIPFLENWAGIMSESNTIDIGTRKSATEIVSLFKLAYDRLFVDMTWVKSQNAPESQVRDTLMQYLSKLIGGMSSLETQIKNNRQKEIGNLIGDEAAKMFCEFYNPKSGRDEHLLTIPECVDITNISKYLKQVTQNQADSVVRRNIILQETGAFIAFAEGNGKISREHYREWVVKSLQYTIIGSGNIGTATPKTALLREFTAESFDALLKGAEAGDIAFAKEVLVAAGVSSDTEISDAVQKVLQIETDIKSGVRKAGTQKKRKSLLLDVNA